MSAGPELGREGWGVTASVTEVSVWGDEESSRIRWWWIHNNANALNATEPYTLKWLSWEIICYMYFTTKPQD